MNFSIRETSQIDYERLRELFAELDRMHRDALPGVFRESGGASRSEEYISNIISNKDACLFVAEQCDQIIGFAQAFIRHTSDIPIMVPRRYAVIEDALVKEGCRRSGVGRSLVRRIEKWASEKGILQVELNVWEFNRGAICFYESIGYGTASRKMYKKALANRKMDSASSAE